MFIHCCVLTYSNMPGVNSRYATLFVGDIPVEDNQAVQTGSGVWELSNTRDTRERARRAVLNAQPVGLSN